MIDDALKEAFRKIYEGEAKALLRLRAYAKVAAMEGLPQIAHLFESIAASEEVHGVRALQRLEILRDTETNLKKSFESEELVAEKAYDAFIRLASEAGDEVALKIFTQSRDVEKTHAQLYKKAMSHMLEERETTYYICKICGYVSDGVLPDVCPVCGAKREHFEEV